MKLHLTFAMGIVLLFCNVTLSFSQTLDPDCKCPYVAKQEELANQFAMEEELNLKVDTAASFRGGDFALRRYQRRLIQNPAKNKQDSTHYTVLCRFVVERDGKISNINMMTHTEPVFKKEALRFMETMPRWVPARASGKAVRSWNLLRFYFGHPDAEDLSMSVSEKAAE